jgi:hypothetical protein
MGVTRSMPYLKALYIDFIKVYLSWASDKSSAGLNAGIFASIFGLSGIFGNLVVGSLLQHYDASLVLLVLTFIGLSASISLGFLR